MLVIPDEYWGTASGNVAIARSKTKSNLCCLGTAQDMINYLGLHSNVRSIRYGEAYIAATEACHLLERRS